MIAAFHRAVEDFTLEAEPYKSMKNQFGPTRYMIKLEMLWRDPSRKKLSNVKMKDLTKILLSAELRIMNEVDLRFLKMQEKDSKVVLVQAKKEKEASDGNGSP